MFTLSFRVETLKLSNVSCYWCFPSVYVCSAAQMCISAKSIERSLLNDSKVDSSPVLTKRNGRSPTGMKSWCLGPIWLSHSKPTKPTSQPQAHLYFNTWIIANWQRKGANCTQLHIFCVLNYEQISDAKDAQLSTSPQYIMYVCACYL